MGGHLSLLFSRDRNPTSDWSILSESSYKERIQIEEDNKVVFKELQRKWGLFFRTFNVEGGWGDLVMGKKFASGGQAEIHEAEVTWSRSFDNELDHICGCKYVLKVFKRGTLLRQLQALWPEKYLDLRCDKLKERIRTKYRFYCAVVCGTLLTDGRFAFLIGKEQIDLHSLIKAHQPFEAERIMYKVARGLEWLHELDIVHRDVKPSNVLCTKYEGGWGCVIADFECSVGVAGTTSYMAPEISKALKAWRERHEPVDEALYSKAADVYSFGITCFQILTGRFEPQSHNDRVSVITEEEMPPWVRDLVIGCWRQEPEDRLTIGDIVDILEHRSEAVRNSDDLKTKGLVEPYMSLKV